MKHRKVKFGIILICISVLYIMCLYYNTQYYKTTKTLTITKDELQITQSLLQDAQDELGTAQNQLNTTQDELQVEIEKSAGLSEALGEKNKELDIANETISALQNDEYELVYMGEFKITYYCDESYRHICGHGNNLTASGKMTEVGWTAAADWSVLPNGSIIYIDGIGFREVMDVGGSVKNNHVDVLVQGHQEALDLGIDYEDVWVLIKKTS